LSKRLRTALAIFAIWTAVATLAGLGSLIYRARAGNTPNVGEFFAELYIDWYSCAVFTPFIFWLSRRFPINRRRLVPHVLLHIGSTIAFIALRLAIYLPIATRMNWTDPRVTFGDQMLRSAFSLTLTYWIVLAAEHGLKYYRVQQQLERSLAQARLHALKAQIHPHFIFNALNAVATLMHRDVAAADRMVVELGELLRESMQVDGKQLNTLADELRLVRNYLNIMQIRYGDRLQVEIQADAEAQRVLVPQLLLQPIVENAIRHGISESTSSGRIVVSARRRGNRLELTVQDNGAGFTERPPRFGVGLQNTAQRLQQLYQDDASMDFGEAGAGGARVAIVLPVRTESE
jgi:two-component system, LytTR family, sensor kinase